MDELNLHIHPLPFRTRPRNVDYLIIFPMYFDVCSHDIAWLASAILCRSFRYILR